MAARPHRAAIYVENMGDGNGSTSEIRREVTFDALSRRPERCAGLATEAAYDSLKPRPMPRGALTVDRSGIST
jgi:hypothetical protein